MRAGLTISAIGHAAVLLASLVSFAPKSLDARQSAPLPIDIVSSDELSQMRAGSKAPKAEKPKPLVEKIAEPKAVTSEAQKVVDKPEIVNAFAPQPPMPEPKPEPKPEIKPRPEPKPEAKAEPKPKEPDPNADPIADAIKQDEAKKPDPKPETKPEAKKVEAKKPEPKKPDPVKPRAFSSLQIAALLDKRDPQRQAATGETLSQAPSLGMPTGTAVRLSQSELDALRARLRDCWSPPAGAASADKLKVPILIRFKQDGTLAGPPQPEVTPHDSYMQAMTDSAVRATIRCQPYTMLSPAKYETWKEIIVDFSMDGMFGG